MKITEHAARPVELDQTAVGRLSRMDALQNQPRTLQEREEMRLAAIREALGRLEVGTYGTCTECDEAIGFDRLYVVPEAADCGRCR